jgi:hypothetical protein
VFNSGITRNLYAAMREVWMLQVDFDMPNVAKFDHLLKSPRFRQGWHLFSLRHDFLQVDPQIFKWWAQFMDSSEADKTELLVELVDLAPRESKKKNKRKKSKRRRKAGVSHSVETFAIE